MKASQKQLATICAVCERVGLDADERLELMRYLLADDTVTLGRLDDRSASRIIDALAGYEAVCTLLDMRPAWLARRRALLLRPKAATG